MPPSRNPLSLAAIPVLPLAPFAVLLLLLLLLLPIHVVMKFAGIAQAWTALTCFVSVFVAPASAIDLDPTNPDSVRTAAKDVAQVLWSMYATPDNKVISGIDGLLTYPPYYWWQAGAMFGQLIDYWYYTNDSTYNDMIRTGLIHQAGELWDYVSRFFQLFPWLYPSQW